MQIVHVVNSVNPMNGGPIEGVKQLAAALYTLGHTVEVASLDDPAASYAKAFPLPLYALGPSFHRYRFSSALVPWLRENARRYDVVVVNGIWGYASFGTWRALRQSGTPYAIFTHGMLDPWFKHQYPLKHLKKWLYWPWAEYRVLRDASAVIFTSEEERLLARRSFWLYAARERVVNYGTALPNGDPEVQKNAFFDRFPKTRGKRLVLFIGRIHPKKGCELAIRAFASVMGEGPDWHLVMAGPDQIGWQRELSEMADSLGLADRTTWTGMLTGDVKWGSIRASEVLLLPSHQENFGIVVAEALACGVPTLISNKVNIWREVEDAGAGLVADDNVQGATQLLRSWIGMSAEQRYRMRLRAKACFEEQFAIGRAAMSLIRILSSLTASGTFAKSNASLSTP